MVKRIVMILGSAFVAGFLLAFGSDVRAVEFMPVLAIVLLIYGVVLAREVDALLGGEPGSVAASQNARPGGAPARQR